MHVELARREKILGIDVVGLRVGDCQRLKLSRLHGPLEYYCIVQLCRQELVVNKFKKMENN